MSVMLPTEHHLEFLTLKVGYSGSFESIAVELPHRWKSHVAAHGPVHDLVERIAYTLHCKPFFKRTCAGLGGLLDLMLARAFIYPSLPRCMRAVNALVNLHYLTTLLRNICKLLKMRCTEKV